MTEEQITMLKKYHEAEDHVLGFRPHGVYVKDYKEFMKSVSKQDFPVSEIGEKLRKQSEEYLSRQEKRKIESVFVPEIDLEEYTNVIEAKPRGDEKEFIQYPTRLIENIEDIDGVVKAKKFERDCWGGILCDKGKKTGYFHLEQIENRFWLIDPAGNPCYMAGITAVNPSMSPRAEKNAIDKFGSKEKWAKETVERLQELGFVTAGAWSDNESLNGTGKTFGQCGMCYFITDYAAEKGLTTPGMGHALFLQNNTMPVFDPDFESFVMKYAKEKIEPLAERSSIVGWFSDNELPTMLNMLERSLTLDPSEASNIYTLTAAWTFLQQISHKDNPSIDDVTVDISEAFRGFVFEQYFSVVARAIKASDPNHLYLGCRFSYMGPEYKEGTPVSRTLMEAAGRWGDIVSVNYYFAWQPDAEVIRNWIQWSGKPFMISEWYAMEVKPGAGYVTGAGFKVKTQKDRAAYYENFVLWLLECPWCAGFHWFMYMDNDSQDANAEASNRNGNKGIVTVEYQEWKELTASMQKINTCIPELICFFDCRNSRKES